METSAEMLANFRKFVNAAPTTPQAEEYVRTFIAGVAKNCPMDVLVQLGQFVADLRRSELQRASEQN